MRTLVDLPHEILVMAFDYRIEAGDPTLRSLALTCRVVSDAAMEVLYRVVTLKNEEQVTLFAALTKAPRRRRKTRKSSPLALVRCLSTPPTQTTITNKTVDYSKLFSSVIDACTNLTMLQTSGAVAFKGAESLDRSRIRTLILEGSGDSIFSRVPAAKFSALERLHIPGLFCNAPSPEHIRDLFSPSIFPNLKIISIGMGCPVLTSTSPLHLDLQKGLRALLALPKIERVVLALPIRSNLIEPELITAFQQFKDARIYVNIIGCGYHYTRGVDTVTYAWSFTAYHIRDMFLAGAPVTSLKPVGILDQPPKYFEGDMVASWEF